MSEFLFVSRMSITPVEFLVYDGSNVLVDADAPPTVTMKDYTDDSVIFTRATTSTATGVYSVTISSVESANAGLFYLDYTYNLSAVPQTWRTDIEIPDARASSYEAIGDADRAIVEQTWMRFSDMFDSAIGGPHLAEYAQASGFGRERLAQLLTIAMNRINTSSQPPQTFSVAIGDFPYSTWGGLLEHSLYIETLRHLIRSYTEQPNPQGLQTVRLDRSQYDQKWRAILSDELPAFNDALESFKISSLNLGRAAVLVGGGVFGEWSRPIPVTRPRNRLPFRGW